LRVDEPAHADDPDSRHPDLTPGFVAYSASGTVEAPVAYVNYGLPADYDRLNAAGVDVRGKIVLARCGRSHRAVKIFTAEQRGAAGIVITAIRGRRESRGRSVAARPVAGALPAAARQREAAGSGTATR
jgi:hypothetical protein